MQYADDAAAIVQAATEEECVAKMTEKMRRLGEWVAEWRLPLNLSKCEYTLFTKKRQ